ncbi:MAG TPA: hypothetical protein ENI92_06125, partial [Bacteroidetes bacterium]|nr:hypothetical protein [Bacteroidota bacterium]
MSTISGNHYSSPTLQGQLKMARDALLAQQTAMSVLSHNVANVNTEGYHRQRAIMESRTPLDGHPGQIGGGVNVQRIERLADTFAEQQVRMESGTVGRWQAQRDGMMQVEQVFGENRDYALSGALDEFWNSWEDFANDADSITSRLNVIARGQNLARAFRQTAEQLG